MTNVQMSSYVNLELYDRVELNHPFYKELMEEMTLEVESVHPKRVLELGAGTGHFTNYLSQINTELVITEYDENCFKILKTKFPSAIMADAVIYCNGTFDVITASLMYHHIRMSRRMDFLLNVKRNLSDSGTFVIGVQLVPDFTTEEERLSATRKSHEYFITKLNEQNSYECMDLQKIFLENTLRGEEYKISERIMDENFKNAGFVIERKEKIGPKNESDVGWIYLYSLKKALSL